MKFASRKFLMAAVAIVTAIVSMIAGAIPVDAGLKIILSVVVAYVGAEGIVDLGHALNTKTKKK